MSIFPFSIQFQQPLSGPVGLAELLPVVKASIDAERTGRTNKDPVIVDRKIVFKNSIFTRNSFHAIEKGFFEISSAGGKTILSYRFWMYRYFAIALIIINGVAICIHSLFSRGYFACYLYLLLIWSGSLISQKVRLRDITKCIEISKSTEEHEQTFSGFR